MTKWTHRSKSFLLQNTTIILLLLYKTSLIILIIIIITIIVIIIIITHTKIANDKISAYFIHQSKKQTKKIRLYHSDQHK